MTIANILETSPRSGAVAIVGHASDAGEPIPGTRFAPAELRARLFRLPLDPARAPRAAFDLGDAAIPAGPLGYQSLRIGGRATLAADAAAISHEVDRLLVLQVSGQPGELELKPGSAHVRFGARDLAPADDVVTLDEWLDAGVSLAEVAARRVPLTRPRPAFLAIHLDAFTLPGVAEPSALGLDPNAFWPVMRTWLKRLDVRALGLYGLNPPLDARGVTNDFAARLAHQFLHV